MPNLNSEPEPRINPLKVEEPLFAPPRKSPPLPRSIRPEPLIAPVVSLMLFTSSNPELEMVMAELSAI